MRQERYYCELPSVQTGQIYSTCAEFASDGEAINYYLSEFSRKVKRVYYRRMRINFNFEANTHINEWVTVPVYTRID